MKNEKNVAFIPVRGGSKSIPLKNVKLFCGHPLVYWAINAAERSEAVDEIYVSTDSDVIRETVEELSFSKVEVIDRGAYTATDDASTESAMIEFAEGNMFDNIVLIQATSPLITSKDIDGGFQLYKKDGIDSVLSVVLQKRFLWDLRDECVTYPINYDVKNRPRRQEFLGYYVENGAFYICSRENLLLSKCRLQGRIGAYQMDEKTYFEIDEPSDWLIMEAIMNNRNIEG